VNPGKGIYIRGQVYWLKFQRNGLRHYVSLQTTDPAEAAKRAIHARASGDLAARSPLQVAIDRYLAKKRDLNVYSRATERVTRAALEEFAQTIPGVTVERIGKRDIESHYARLQARVAETTAQIHMRSLRAFLNWCAAEGGLCQRSPFAGVRLATIDQPARLRFCTKEERDSLISSAPTDDLRFILMAGFLCGMRKGEIIEARVSWFQLHESGAVHIQNTPSFRIKDRDARAVPLTKSFSEFLRSYLDSKEANAFALKPAVRHGRGTYRYDFHRPYNDYLISQDKRWVTAHVMRHTFASLLVQAGVSVYKVAKWLGDGVDVVQEHYAHLAAHDPDIERMV
jgi:integrase